MLLREFVSPEIVTVKLPAKEEHDNPTAQMWRQTHFSH